LEILEEHIRSQREGAQQAKDEESNWWDESAELTGELLSAGALEELLSARRSALLDAERRLADGTYGLSVKSGESIPDERLEADPLATLTVDEAAAEAGVHGSAALRNSQP
jgi:DnaK suppressor protein